MYSSMGNVSLQSVHAEMAFATLLYRGHWSNWVMWSNLHIETRSRVIRFSCENVVRIDHFSPANNSFVLLSRVIVSVHIIIFCAFDRVYVLFRF